MLIIITSTADIIYVLPGPILHAPYSYNIPSNFFLPPSVLLPPELPLLLLFELTFTGLHTAIPAQSELSASRSMFGAIVGEMSPISCLGDFCYAVRFIIHQCNEGKHTAGSAAARPRRVTKTVRLNCIFNVWYRRRMRRARRSRSFSEWRCGLRNSCVDELKL